MQNEQTVASGQNRVKLGNLSLHFLNHPYVLTTYVAVTTKKKTIWTILNIRVTNTEQ